MILEADKNAPSAGANAIPMRPDDISKADNENVVNEPSNVAPRPSPPPSADSVPRPRTPHDSGSSQDTTLNQNLLYYLDLYSTLIRRDVFFKTNELAENCNLQIAASRKIENSLYRIYSEPEYFYNVISFPFCGNSQCYKMYYSDSIFVNANGEACANPKLVNELNMLYFCGGPPLPQFDSACEYKLKNCEFELVNDSMPYKLDESTLIVPHDNMLFKNVGKKLVPVFNISLVPTFESNLYDVEKKHFFLTKKQIDEALVNDDYINAFLDMILSYTYPPWFKIAAFGLTILGLFGIIIALFKVGKKCLKNGLTWYLFLLHRFVPVQQHDEVEMENL